MLAYRALDEYGAHWICGICAQGDFGTKEAANLCCSQLVARDVPVTRAKAMQLTAKQTRERSMPILGLRRPGR